MYYKERLAHSRPKVVPIGDQTQYNIGHNTFTLRPRETLDTVWINHNSDLRVSMQIESVKMTHIRMNRNFKRNENNH